MDQAGHREFVDVLPPALLIGGGVMMAVLGRAVGSGLLTWFPAVGIALGGGQLFYWLRSPTTKQHWWFEHMTGMFSSGIAAVTAFLVVGAPRLVSVVGTHWLLWVAPSLVMVPVLVVWQQWYRRRFADNTGRPTTDQRLGVGDRSAQLEESPRDRTPAPTQNRHDTHAIFS